MVTVNHEFRANFREDKLQDVASKSCEPVSMGNLRDHPVEDLFQNGLQTFSFEVNTGSNVFDDDVVRVRFLEVFNLAFEISTLLGAADSGVDVISLCSVLLPKKTLDSIDIVHSFAARESDVLQNSGGRPCTECSG